MKGYIGKLVEKINTLKDNGWINNRTRAVFTEFSVYNAQVNKQSLTLCSCRWKIEIVKCTLILGEGKRGDWMMALS